MIGHTNRDNNLINIDSLLLHLELFWTRNQGWRRVYGYDVFSVPERIWFHLWDSFSTWPGMLSSKKIIRKLYFFDVFF